MSKTWIVITIIVVAGTCIVTAMLMGYDLSGLLPFLSDVVHSITGK